MQYETGQTVLYCPRSHPGIHRATVLGRSADEKGWQIRLEDGGVKEVADIEDWRMCLADQPCQSLVPDITASAGDEGLTLADRLYRAPAAQEAGEGSDIPVPSGQLPLQRVKAASSTSTLPVSSGGTTTSTTTPTSATPGSSASAGTSACEPAAQARTGYPGVAPGAAGTPQTKNVVRYTAPPANSAVGGCRGYAASVIARQASNVPPPSLLTPGRRIVYTARSNGHPYPGVVVGTLPGRPGFHLHLDCGEPKDVEEQEVWRIALA